MSTIAADGKKRLLRPVGEEASSSESEDEASSGSSSSSSEDDSEQEREGEAEVVARLRSELEQCRRLVVEEREAGKAALVAKQQEFEKFLEDEPEQLAVENRTLLQRCNEAEAALSAHFKRAEALAARCSEAEAALDMADAREQTLAAEKEALAEQCQSMVGATRAAEAETARLLASIDQLQRQCTEQEEEKRRTEGSLSAATAQLGQLESQLLVEQQGRAALQQEADQLTVALTERERDRERLEELRAELCAECQRLREEHSQLDATNGAAAAELAEVRAAAEQRRVEGDREHAVALSALQDQLSAVHFSLREQTDATDAATAKLKEVRTKYHVLKSATDVAQAMDLAVRSTSTEEDDRIQLAQLRLQHQELEASYRGLVDENARQLKASAAEREAEREQAVSAVAAHEKTQQALKVLETAYSELTETHESALATACTRQKSLEAAQEGMQRLHEAALAKALSDASERVQRQQEEEQASREALQTLESQHAELKQAYQSLICQSEEHLSHRMLLEERVVESERKAAAAVAAQRITTDVHDTLHVEHTELKSVHAASVAELQEAQASAARARDALEEERQRVAAAVAAHEETQQAFEALTRAHSALGEEVHSKHDELRNFAVERASAAQTLEETVAAHSAAVAELAQAKAEAQAAASAAAAKHAELEEKVAAIEDQCLQAQTASDCEQRLTEAQMEDLQRRHDELEEQVIAMQQETLRVDSEARVAALLMEHEAAAAKVEQVLVDRVQAAKVEIISATESAQAAHHARKLAEREASELRAKLEMAEARAAQEVSELKDELADESRRLMKAQLELAAANSRVGEGVAATKNESASPDGHPSPHTGAHASAAVVTSGLQAQQPARQSIKDQTRERSNSDTNGKARMASRYRVVAPAKIRSGWDASSTDLGRADPGDML